MHERTSCAIRPMQTQDLEMVLAWRNHPAIRQHMLTQHLISLDEHRQWFERANNNAQRKIMLVEHDHIPYGLVHFTGVSPHASVDWGFYVAPDAPKGSGTLLGQSALVFAFKELQVHKLCGQVMEDNAASIRFHERLGFTLEGRLREQILVQSRRHNLLCFGLLRREWLANSTVER
jgi:UDP-4-amino-4,6-dideoxy-N-acetyl-beta-L-altrosamine N-acetyltransferase